MLFEVRVRRAVAAVSIMTSLIYLSLELSFHSYLIDFFGSWPSSNEIHRIEVYGRSLAGIAFALILVPWFVGFAVRRLSISTWTKVIIVYASIVLVVFPLSIVIARISIEKAVVYLTDLTTPQQRRDSLIAVFITSRVHDRATGAPSVLVNGREWKSDLTESTPGRFILAGLPFFLARVPNLEEMTLRQIETIIRYKITDEAPSAEQVFNSVYVPLVGAVVVDGYKAFHDADERRARQMSINIYDGYQDWADYEQSLRQKNLTPSQVAANPRLRERVSGALRQRDGSLPVGWVPLGPQDFVVHRDHAARGVYDGVLLKLGFPNPSTVVGILNINDYIKSPEIRKKWCDEVRARLKSGLGARIAGKMCDFGPRLQYNGIFPAFRSEVITAAIDEETRVAFAKFASEVRGYEKSGLFGADAYEAAKISIVLPMAIAISLMGGILHFSKIVFVVSRSFMPLRVAWIPAAVVLVGVHLFALSSGMPAVVRGYEANFALFKSVWGVYGELGSAILIILINIERIVYPIGDFLVKVVYSALFIGL